MKLTSLVGFQIKNNFSFKRFFGFDLKKNKTKSILIIVAIIYAIISMAATFGYLFFDLGKTLNQMNQIHLLLNFTAVYIIGFTIMTVLLRSSGFLFYYKDYEILAPLPINPKKLFLSKLSVLLVMINAVNFIATLPIMFAFFYWNGLTILGLLFYIVSMIFIPLIPLMVMSIISLGISLMTSKMRNSKIISIILMMAVLVIIMALSFTLNETEVNPLTGQIDLFTNMTKFYLPFKWFNNAIYNKSILDLSYIVVSHGALLILYIHFVSKLAEFTNKRGLRSKVTYKQKEISYQENPVITTLVKKEFKKFFNSTLYALNSGFGLVFMVVLSIASLFFKTDIEALFTHEFGIVFAPELIVMAAFAFMIGLTYTPAISLSLEGKNLWILKSLPIKASKVMYSKIAFNLVLIIPIALVSVIMLGISLSISILSIFLLMLLIVTYAVMLSFMYAVINLYLPKFDFNNDAEVVKQSAAALIALLTVFMMMIVYGFGYYFLNKILDLDIIMLIFIAFSIILTIPFFIIIKDKSKKIFLNF